MTETIIPNDEILEIARSYDFDTAKYVGKWNKYDVFRPALNNPDDAAFIGEPIYILQKGKEIRESAPWEWPEIMDAILK